MPDIAGNDVLTDYYKQYIGDPDRPIDIYAGFGLFFIGVGLIFVGIVVFLYSATFDETVYSLRELAVVSGAIGAPTLLAGIVVLLPVDRRMLGVTAVGAMICAVGIFRFSTVYPHQFNVTGEDYAAQVVGIYSVGLVLIIAATAAANIAHRIEQATESVDQVATPDNDEDIDKQVQADIERELNNADLSWGGVEKRDTRTLNLDTSMVDDIDRESFANATVETRTDDSSVTDAVSRLQGLQGGNKNTANRDSTDDQVASLKQLQQNQQAEDEPTPTLLDRLRSFILRR